MTDVKGIIVSYLGDQLSLILCTTVDVMGSLTLGDVSVHCECVL